MPSALSFAKLCQTSLRLRAAHGVLRRRLQFVLAHRCAQRRRDRPEVSERVFDLPVTIAPEHVLWRHLQLRARRHRSEEHTSELQSLMRISYAVFCLKQKTTATYKTIENK